MLDNDHRWRSLQNATRRRGALQLINGIKVLRRFPQWELRMPIKMSLTTKGKQLPSGNTIRETIVLIKVLSVSD